MTEMIDANGHSIKYSYDACNRLTKVEQARMVDPVLGEIQQAEMQSTTYEYNRRGDVVAVHAPMNKTTQFTYTADGRVATKVDEDGFETCFSYTAFGKIAQVSYADGKQVHLKYDALRQLSEMQDWLGRTKIESDMLGRVKKVTSPDGKALGYEWDEAGHRKKMIYPDGTEVEYSYTPTGRIAEVKAAGGITRYQYDSAGRFQCREMPDGLISNHEYDSLGRLTKLTHLQNDKILDDFSYQYDAIGNITQIEKQRLGLPEDSGLFTYAYDPLNRLIEATKGGQTKQYAYDTVGNRIFTQQGGQKQHYQYNALNQLVGLQEEANTSEYSYDGRGNLTGVLENDAMTAEYWYDATNMLVKAQNTHKGMEEYGYNGLRRRVLKQTGIQNPQAEVESRLDKATESVQYLVDLTKPYHNLLHTETDGTIAQNFIWGNELLASEGDISYTYLQDHLGTPIRLVEDEASNAPLACDEFGVPVVQAGKALHNPFGFTGYQTDEVSGLQYAQARYYAPSMGRMMAIDPARVGYNWYDYCYSNPVCRIDFDGMDSVLFWDPNTFWDAEKHRDIMIDQLEKEYGTPVQLVITNTNQDFNTGWNNYVQDKDVDAVVVFGHGNEAGFRPGYDEKKNLPGELVGSADLGIVSGKSAISIDKMILLPCNTAATSSSFASSIWDNGALNIEQLIAADGTTSHWLSGWWMWKEYSISANHDKYWSAITGSSEDDQGRFRMWVNGVENPYEMGHEYTFKEMLNLTCEA